MDEASCADGSRRDHLRKIMIGMHFDVQKPAG
jgi:hypothetical protein